VLKASDVGFWVSDLGFSASGGSFKNSFSIFRRTNLSVRYSNQFLHKAVNVAKKFLERAFGFPVESTLSIQVDLEIKSPRSGLQGYLTDKTPPPPWTLPQASA